MEEGPELGLGRWGAAGEVRRVFQAEGKTLALESLWQLGGG